MTNVQLWYFLFNGFSLIRDISIIKKNSSVLQRFALSVNCKSLSTACNKTYGPNCANKCGHCRDDNICDRFTGRCLRGCSPGYISSDNGTSLCDLSKFLFSLYLHSLSLFKNFKAKVAIYFYYQFCCISLFNSYIYIPCDVKIKNCLVGYLITDLKKIKMEKLKNWHGIIIMNEIFLISAYFPIICPIFMIHYFLVYGTITCIHNTVLDER